MWILGEVAASTAQAKALGQEELGVLCLRSSKEAHTAGEGEAGLHKR